jgi:hypothetical protein
MFGVSKQKSVTYLIPTLDSVVLVASLLESTQWNKMEKCNYINLQDML